MRSLGGSRFTQRGFFEGVLGVCSLDGIINDPITLAIDHSFTLWLCQNSY